MDVEPGVPAVSSTDPRDGYCVDEWSRWQQGECGTYMTALLELRPDLRVGGVDFHQDPGFDNPSHFAAHDDVWAYDSAGRHPLPYRGICGTGKWLGDMGTLDDWGFPGEEGDPVISDRDRIEAAKRHIVRNGILEGVWPAER